MFRVNCSPDLELGWGETACALWYNDFDFFDEMEHPERRWDSRT